VRYIDSRSRAPEDTLHAWFRDLLPQATSFAAQTGYYRFGALEPFAREIAQMLAAGGTIDLVIGANEDRLSAVDLDSTLDLLRAHMPQQASFTLVGSRDGLFHPKAYYVETPTTRKAAIGSGNLTIPGSTHNVEAHVLLNEDDGSGILDEVRDAILAWRDDASPDGLAHPVTDQLVQELLAERAIDPVPRSDMASSRRRRSDRARFPRLPPIPGMPAPARRGLTGTRGRRLRGAEPLPSGAIGVVKRLSATDVKGFAGEPGTPYLSLGSRNAPLAQRLPMTPFGERDEPRLDLAVEARLDTALPDLVESGSDPTNITHVGMGSTRGSNPDLRFNLLSGIVGGLLDVAVERKVPPPSVGDVAAIEFLENGRLARLTFVTQDPLRRQLDDSIPSKRAWTWLPPNVLPPW
jgi:hypothetical protein